MQGHEVAECIANVNGQLPPEFADWPAHIQDTLFLAVDNLAKLTGKPYMLFHAICDYDEDTQWYVRAIAVAPRGGGILTLQ